MLSLILAAALYAAPPLQDDTPPADRPPDPAQIEEAVNGLEEAFKKGKTADRLEALAKYGKVCDGQVIEVIAKGLRDKETGVRTASIEALRWMKHPDALEALHQSFKKDRTIRKDDALHEAMIKAIGQHGSPESIDILTENLLADAPRQVHVARIYSLGNIRDKRSVEALMDVMQKTGRRAGKRGGGGQPLMGELRNALLMLTGEDLKDEKAWTDWWKANEKTFEVTPEPTDVPKRVTAQWNRYWGLEQERKKDEDGERKKRRRGEGEGGGEGGDGENGEGGE